MRVVSDRRAEGAQRDGDYEVVLRSDSGADAGREAVHTPSRIYRIRCITGGPVRAGRGLDDAQAGRCWKRRGGAASYSGYSLSERRLMGGGLRDANVRLGQDAKTNSSAIYSTRKCARTCFSSL